METLIIKPHSPGMMVMNTNKLSPTMCEIMEMADERKVKATRAPSTVGRYLVSRPQGFRLESHYHLRGKKGKIKVLKTDFPKRD